MGKKGKRRARDEAAHGADPGPAPRAGAAIDAHDLAARLSASAVHLLRRLHHQDPLGVSGARLSALSTLVAGGPCTIGSLAAAEGVTPPSMTRLVRAMEGDRLVSRSRSATDGRLVIIAATADGEGLLRRGRDQRVAVLAGMLDGLPAADRSALGEAATILEGLLHPARGS